MARPVTGKVMEDRVWVGQPNGTWYCYLRRRVWRDGKTVELERRLLGKADERGGELRPTRPKRRPAPEAEAPGVEATREIRKAAPTVQILVLTTFGTSDGIAYAIEAGALGAMMKSADHEELAEAIRKVAGGEQAISEEVALQMKIDPPVPNLTPRQMEILDSMVRGLNNLDIAKQLGIRRDGVKEHVNAILTKIGASNRTEAVAIALRKHLLKA